MNTQTVRYNLLNIDSKKALQDLNIYDSHVLLTLLEKQLAIAEAGVNAIVAKSFRSARFSLIKNIAAGKSLNVLSFDSTVSWNEDRAIYKRQNTSLFFVNDFPDLNLSEVIKKNKIGLIYISSINEENLRVENHDYIISVAHSNHIPVVFNNTTGGFGSICKPIQYGADYVIVDTTATLKAQTNIGAYIAEGLSPSFNLDVFYGKGNHSLLSVIRNKRSNEKKETYHVSIKDHAPEEFLKNIITNYHKYTTTAFALAKWFNQVSEIAEVNYPGLKTSSYFLNADSTLKGGYGNIIRFKVWDLEFAYTLLKSSFIAGRPDGITISTDDLKKEFIIKIYSSEASEVNTYFKRVFAQLQKELEFRALLKKQLKLETAVKDLLTTYLY